VNYCLSFCPFAFDHCTVYPSSTYGLWLPLYCLFFFNLWPLVTTVLSILLQLMASCYHCTVYPSSTYGLWLPLYCLSFLNLWPLVTTVLSVLLQLMASCYHFGIFKLFSLNSNITLMWIFFLIFSFIFFCKVIIILGFLNHWPLRK
jgi:hypothetical protein